MCEQYYTKNTGWLVQFTHLTAHGIWDSELVAWNIACHTAPNTRSLQSDPRTYAIFRPLQQCLAVPPIVRSIRLVTPAQNTEVLRQVSRAGGAEFSAQAGAGHIVCGESGGHIHIQCGSSQTSTSRALLMNKCTRDSTRGGES